MEGLLSEEVAKWYTSAAPNDIAKVIECGYKTLWGQVNRGKVGEEYVMTILEGCGFNVVKGGKKKADIIIKDDDKNILVEVKDYKTTVPKTEVDKFHRDLECNNSHGGLFISLGSKISNKTTLEISSMTLNTRTIQVIYVATNNKDLIKLCIDYLRISPQKSESKILKEKIVELSGVLSAAIEARSQLQEFQVDLNKKLYDSIKNIMTIECKLDNIIKNN